MNIRSFRSCWKISALILVTILSFCKTPTKEKTKNFYLGSAPFQFVLHEFSAESDFKFEGFKDNVNIISLHTDNFFGIPWDEFMGGERNQNWHKKMEELKRSVDQLGLQVYLSLTPLSGLRNSIAARALDLNGELKVQENWRPGCYNFDTGPNALILRDAFLKYVRWMVNFFKPKFLTHGIEINMYEKTCPDSYLSLIRLLNDVYIQEKAVNPDLPIFPTFTIKDLWGYNDDNIDTDDRSRLIKNLNHQKNILRDRFGISAYPIFLQWKWNKIPDDFFSAIYDITGEKVVFGETGQGNYDVTIPWPGIDDPCFTILHSSDGDQIDYMKFVFNNAVKLDSDLVIWWSLRDYLPYQVLTSCPCSISGIWCAIYNEIYKSGLLGAWMMWGSMGVLDHDGIKKPSFRIWKEWLDKKVITN